MKEIKVDFGGWKRTFGEGEGKLDRPLLRKYHNSVADRVARSREKESWKEILYTDYFSRVEHLRVLHNLIHDRDRISKGEMIESLKIRQYLYIYISNGDLCKDTLEYTSLERLINPFREWPSNGKIRLRACQTQYL